MQTYTQNKNYNVVLNIHKIHLTNFTICIY